MDNFICVGVLIIIVVVTVYFILKAVGIVK
jgi:hypothetical protein